MRRLLLTRTPEKNSELASQLPKLETSFDIVQAQLIKVSGLPLTIAARAIVQALDRYDKIFFISQNAVSFGEELLASYWPQWPLSLSWYAVGPATAESLGQRDIVAVFPEVASSAGLLRLSELQHLEGKKCLIVRGVGGQETLKLGLRERGAEVDYLEVYQREPVKFANDSIFRSAEDTLVPLYSGEALQHLYKLSQGEVSHYSLVVPSERLQNMAITSGFVKVELAKGQDDDAMLAAILPLLENH